MQFYIDIEDSSGVNYGSGPITSASYWRSTTRVDRAGSFEFAFPASDEKASIVQKRRYVACYAILNPGGPTQIGSGIIDKISTRPGANGEVMLIVTGDDLMRELAWRTAGFLACYSGSSPVTHSVAVANLATVSPAGWTRNADASPPNNDIYYAFAGETVLAAAITIAKLSGNHVWMPSKRVLTWAHSWSASGLRAIEAPVNPDLSDTNICLIESLEVVEDTYDLISRAVPYGAEVAGSAQIVTLNNASKAAPSGYTLDTANNYIKNDTAEATYGRIEAFMKFPDIKAQSGGAPDLQSASNMLFDAALHELQQRSSPAQFYRLRLAHSPSIISPFTTIQCIFRRVADGRLVTNINSTLYIMGATVEINSEELRTTDLEVATVDRWADTDGAVLSKLVSDSLRI